jgi:hypothetical protein
VVPPFSPYGWSPQRDDGAALLLLSLPGCQELSPARWCQGRASVFMLPALH